VFIEFAREEGERHTLGVYIDHKHGWTGQGRLPRRPA
jgi:hypothetical protein